MIEPTAPALPSAGEHVWQPQAAHDLRTAQSVSLVRHMPATILGNGLGMALGALALSATYRWSELVFPLVGMAYLLAPIAVAWWRLRQRRFPRTVSAAWLHRQTAYSGVLGCFWAVCLLYYLPGASFDAAHILLLGAGFMTLGAAATLYVLPLAALAFSLPVLTASVVACLGLQEPAAPVLTGVVLLMGGGSTGILWGNSTNFREVVRLIHEKSRLLHEADGVRRAEAEFVENLNHEIRNALTSVIGYFDVASDPDLSPAEHHELIDHARETSGLLQVLLSDLLDVGRLNAGRTRLVLAPFSIRDVVRASIVAASGAIGGRALVVRANVEESVPQVLVGDAARLQQILLNLIGNALKVMDHGTVMVHVRYRETFNPLLEITVSDNGPGISRERQKSLFNRFSRVSEVPAMPGATVGGWGLGLSICAALVELMRGDIRVRSEVGRGADFLIRLPLHQDRRQSPRSPARPAPQPEKHVTFAALEVLVVDDAAANRLILCKMLQALGCKVHLAGDGPTALRACADTRFDLVFMDIELGAMDGVEATRRIRALPGGAGDMAIVAITGYASIERVAAIHESGMNDHVLKPVRLDTIASVLQKWAGHRPHAPTIGR